MNNHLYILCSKIPLELFDGIDSHFDHQPSSVDLEESANQGCKLCKLFVTGYRLNEIRRSMAVKNSNSTDLESKTEEEGHDRSGKGEVVKKTNRIYKKQATLYVRSSRPNELLMVFGGTPYAPMEYHKIPQGEYLWIFHSCAVRLGWPGTPPRAGGLGMIFWGLACQAPKEYSVPDRPSPPFLCLGSWDAIIINRLEQESDSSGAVVSGVCQYYRTAVAQCLLLLLTLARLGGARSKITNRVSPNKHHAPR